MLHEQKLGLFHKKILGEGLGENRDHRLSTSKIDHALAWLQNFSADQKGCLGLSTAKVGKVGFVDEGATQTE